jgi:hypothetical protein
MGANMSPFDEVKVAVDDLFEEARHWLDGSEISSEQEAKAVEQLLELARAEYKKTDTARKVENEPFDKGKAAVQAKYNPLLKRAELVADTCKRVLTPWRDRIAREKAEKAERARKEAEELDAKAQAAMRASSGNVVERAKAEEQLAIAKDASGFARREAKRASEGLGLRTSHRVELKDPGAAAQHYWKARPADFQAFLYELAARDVRAGIRSIPGFDVIEEKTAV